MFMSQTFEAKLTTSGALIGKDVRIPEHETLSFERSFITLVDLLEKRDEEKTALIRAHLHFNSARTATHQNKSLQRTSQNKSPQRTRQNKSPQRTSQNKSPQRTSPNKSPL